MSDFYEQYLEKTRKRDLEKKQRFHRWVAYSVWSYLGLWFGVMAVFLTHNPQHRMEAFWGANVLMGVPAVIAVVCLAAHYSWDA